MNIKSKIEFEENGFEEKKKATSKWILPVAKRGNILPILLLLGINDSLVSGAAGIAKAMNDNKAMQCQLEELKHHNRVMEDYGFILLHTKTIEVFWEKKRQETLKIAKIVTNNV